MNHNISIQNAFLTALFFLFFSSTLHSQYGCGTPSNKDWFLEKELLGGRSYLKKDYVHTRALIYIPIHYHVVRKDDGTGGFPLYWLLKMHCELNQRYAPSNIRFYIDTVSYINSTKYYDLTQTEETALTSTYNTLMDCNVYLVNDPAGNCGYTYTPNTFRTPSSRSSIFLAASLGNYTCTQPGSTTLPHEMGHWLDLEHTFSGWEGKTYGSTGQLATNLRENVDRTGVNANCTTRGDGFCGTSPDYISDRWTCTNGLSPLNYIDPKNVTFKVDGTNYMSYANDACASKFSSDQMAHFDWTMSNFNERKDLLTLPVPDYVTFDSMTTFFPKTSTNKVLKNGLKLKYQKVPGANYYHVMICRGTIALSANFTFASNTLVLDTIVSDTFVNVPSTLFSTNDTRYYYWKVIPFSKMNNCQEKAIPFQAFRVIDLPITVQSRNIICNGENNGFVSASVTSGVGYSFNVNGSNAFLDSINNLSAGFYTINIIQNGVTVGITNVDIQEPTEATFTAAQTANSITITGTGGTLPYKYKWSNGTTSNKLTNMTSGTYTVTVSDAKGCKETVFTKKISGSSINNTLNNNYFEVYPNPITTEGDFNIYSNMLDGKNYQLTIYSLEGRLIYQQPLYNKSKVLPINWNQRTRGHYVMEISSEGESLEVHKVVVQ